MCRFIAHSRSFPLIPASPSAGHTLAGIMVHYENTLRRAQEMEGWLEQQRCLLDQLESDCGGQLYTTLVELAEILYSDVGEVCPGGAGGGGLSSSRTVQWLSVLCINFRRPNLAPQKGCFVAKYNNENRGLLLARRGSSNYESD